MASNIFRKTALDNIATPEQLDQQVKIMKPVSWLIFMTLIIGFISVVLWSITGNITNNMNFSGVIFPNSDVSNILTNSSGILTDVLVEEGDYVEVGDILGFVYNQELLNNMKSINTKTNEIVSKELSEKEIEHYVNMSVIESSYSGYIQSIKRKDVVVERGDNIAVIMNDDKANTYNEVVMYVPIENAKILRLGMEAQISPSYAKREEYGYISGVITGISSNIVTEESIIKHMGTLDYVTDIIPSKSSVEVRIKLNLNSNSEGEEVYQWSQKSGKSLSLEVGTICDVLIVIKKQKPIDLLLP